MTIWLLALVLMAGLAAAGYRQGAIRVSISLAGLVVGALLAIPLAPLARRILPPLGVVHPILLWSLAPFIVFVLVQILFKSAGLFVHKKVEVYYKYKAGDLRHSLWERLNRRLGACLGLVNGAVYLVLISLVVYPFSYLTYQVASGTGDSRLMKLVVRMGTDLGSTGLVKAVVAIDPVPAAYYDVADIVGLLYKDVRVHGRLGRYPLYMHLAEQPPFDRLGSDRGFRDLFVRHQPIGAILDNPNTQLVFNNPEQLTSLWNLTLPNLKDLRTYLETGKSTLYDSEVILGHWSFDKHSSLLALKRDNPDLTTLQLTRARVLLYPILETNRFIAYPDKKATLKGFVTFNWAAAKRPPTATAAARSMTPQPMPVQPTPGRGGGGRGITARGLTARINPAAPPPVTPVAPVPGAAPGAPALNLVSAPQDLDGRWDRTSDGRYRLNFGGRSFAAVMDGDRITLSGDATPLVFERD